MLTFILVTLLNFSFAQSQETPQPTSWISALSLRTETTLPLFVGIGVGFEANSQFEVALFWGLTPEPYYNLIGEAAANLGGNKSYKDVIRAAFQNNQVAKHQAQYFFEKKGQGWNMGVMGYLITSSGEAEIDTVLAASTGKDFSNLKALLTALGRSTKVSMQGALGIFEIRGGYEHQINPNQMLRTFAGLAKVFGADVQLKTGLTTFESTQAGQNLMRQAESDLEKIIVDNGFTPTLGIEYSYFF